MIIFLYKFLLIFFFVHLKYKVFGKNENDLDDKNYVYLTDMVTTHHVIPYLALDQCMLRPGQQHHGSFGFIFERPGNLLCDELLICYPGQLSGNNTLNGMITTIPYRLGKHAENPIKVLCAEKRAEFCKKEGACSVGNPASHIWHGIKLSSVYEKHTGYNESIFITKIKLSFTDKEYLLNKTSLFAIELGDKEHFASSVREMHKKNSKFVPGKIINMTDGRKLSEKFFAHVNIGAYLHNYTGIWTIGLDLLPTSGQRNLHLFVYRGCACGMEAWFKTPTTKGHLAPKNLTKLVSMGRGQLYDDKICPERKTKNKLYSLGNITDGELLVNFTLWTGTRGKVAVVELLDDNNNIVLNLFTNSTMLLHTFEGKIVASYDQGKNLLDIGLTMTMTFRITKYYIWVGCASELWGNQFPVYKFWSKKWWEGKLFNKSKNAKLRIDGDFLSITPVLTRTLNETDIVNLSDKFNHKITPNEFYIDTISGDNVTFRFYCLNITKNFDLHLLKNEEQLFEIDVIFYTIPKINTYRRSEGDGSKKSSETTLIAKEKPFELNITATKINNNLTEINVEFYGIKLNNTVFTDKQIWMINRIKLVGGFELGDFMQYENELKPPYLKHKRELYQVDVNNTILCFEAKVPKADNMSQDKSFQVYLLNGANDFSENYGETVLMLNFSFDPDIYTELGENVSYTLGTNSFLYLNSDFQNGSGWELNQEKHLNPIHTDVPIIVLIYADEHFFKIGINKATDYIHYKYRIPPWIITHAMASFYFYNYSQDMAKNLHTVFPKITQRFKITGNIHNVVFHEYDKFLENCQTDLLQQELDGKILRLKRTLLEDDEIVIKGIIPKSFNDDVIVNFLHGTFKFSEKYGKTVFRLLIKRNISIKNSYQNHKWKYQGLTGTNEEKNVKEFKEGDRLRLSFTFTPTRICVKIETEESMKLFSYYTDTGLDFELTHYVEVSGLEVINGTNLFSMRKKPKQLSDSCTN